MAILKVFRQGNSAGTQVVNFAVSGTATLNTDYTVTFPSGITGTFAAATGSVTIPSGSLFVDINLTAVPDSVSEPDETVIITFTSSSPVVPALPGQESCVFVLKNDDFLTVIKWLAIGTATAVPAGTTLAGTNRTRDNGSNNVPHWISSNDGLAPANFANWFTGPLTSIPTTCSAHIAASGVPAFLNSTQVGIAKVVFRTPVTGVAATIRLYESLGSTSCVVDLIGSSGVFDIRVSSTGGSILTPFTGLIPNTWYDFILNYSPTSTRYYLNTASSIIAGPSISSGAGAGTDWAIRAGGSIAIAAVSLITTLPFQASMLPITSANL